MLVVGTPAGAKVTPTSGLLPASADAALHCLLSKLSYSQAVGSQLVRLQ